MNSTSTVGKRLVNPLETMKPPITDATFHHVMIAIPTGSEESARHFYGDVLGLTEIAKPESLRGRGGLWFRFNGGELHLGVDRDFHPARKAHVAFQVADLRALHERLITAGFAVESDDLLPGFARFYVNDPFGNRLEFLEPARSPSDS